MVGTDECSHKRSAARHARHPSTAASVPIAPARLAHVRRSLLEWMRTARRGFFWRNPDVSPFALLVTEILLSRTRAQSVEPVAMRLLARFPEATDLAHADIGEVALILRPLGLHRKRALRLVECARQLLSRLDGEVPRSPAELMTLPYVGRYTANAVACFAFGRRRAVIDANVSRVYQRLFSLPTPPARLSAADQLWEFGRRVLPRSGLAAKEFNWAILDLGGMVCTPRRPSCVLCPVAFTCDAHEKGTCGCVKDATST